METTELFDAVEEAISNFEIAGARGDHAQNWHAIRVRPDGLVYVSEEPSPCFSGDEYHGKIPHTLTIHSQHGDCFHPSRDNNPGWCVNDDGTLDLNDWVGDRPDADDVCPQWRARLQNWIDCGNYNPE
jgi:hypothetical protein